MTRFMTFASIAIFGLSACEKGKEQSQASDSTARNLTLAPPESPAAMRDGPANPPAAVTKPTPPPATRPPAQRRPTAPAMLHVGAGTTMDIAAVDTISSRSAKVGDAFTARVVEDIRNAAGKVVIPAGSVVNGKSADVKPAPNPNTPGTLTLSVSSITVRGTSYPIQASVDSLETIHNGRGVTTGDAAKVGAGAAAGAILGRVLGGNKKGTIIGGIVGGAAGAAVAHSTKDSDIVLPAGAHIMIRLTQEVAVAAS